MFDTSCTQIVLGPEPFVGAEGSSSPATDQSSRLPVSVRAAPAS